MTHKPVNPNQKPGVFGNKVVREDVLAAFSRGDKAALVSAKSVVLPDPITIPPAPSAQQNQHTPQEQARLNYDLLLAVDAGDISKARVALNAGASIDSKFSIHGLICPDDIGSLGVIGSLDNGDTALMRAVKNMDHIMVEFLLTNGANPNLDYNYGSFPYPSALTYAKRNNDSQMTALLKRYNATNEGSK